MANIIDILRSNFSGCKYSASEEIPSPEILQPTEEQFLAASYDSLVWHEENTVAKPTLEEILALSSATDLKIAKDLKKEEVKNQRIANISRNLTAEVVDGATYYVETHPEHDLFVTGSSMAEGETVMWGCLLDGKKVSRSFSKSKMIELSGHYRQRKNQEYYQCDQRRIAIDVLTTIEEVQNYDITQVYV